MRGLRLALAILVPAFVLPWAQGAVAATPDRLRFQAPPGESLLVHGTYPPVDSECVDPDQPVLHSRHRGTIEVGRDEDGSLFVIAELAFEDYLKGIAEVPRYWPMEALKAQVVAARTYALSRFDPPGSIGGVQYNLCATDACQVYLGMGIEAGAWGRHWVDAVESTAGEVLLYEGEPASTFYFSTSNGRTYTNQEVWGSDPLPYLPSVQEQDDGESPLSRWSVTMPFDDLARFLARAGLWPGGSIKEVRQSGGRVVVEGGSSSVSLTKSELRSALNAEAPCRAPDRYPTTEPDGYRLPQTVPSVWYRARQEGRSLVMTGRGWGHGIGMVQWGAKGKADRDLTYPEILSFYYNGLSPEAIDAPGTIRILVASGLRTVTVAPSGEAEIRSFGAGRPPWNARGPEPPWRLTGGKRLRLRQGPQPPRLLEVSASFPHGRAETGEHFPARVDLPTSVKIRFEFMQRGAVVGATPWRAYTSDARRIGATVPAISEGRYAVRIAASNGIDTVTTSRRPIMVAGGTGPAETPRPAPSPKAFHPSVNATGGPVRWPVLAGLLGAAAASGLGIAWRRHRSRVRSS